MSSQDAQAFQARFDVSRETMERLELYHTLLQKWSRGINLVARSSLDDVWRRHFADSAQLLDLASRDAKQWLDLGSGAGFPGLVIAILAQQKRPELSCTLLDSDARKGEFLRTVIRHAKIGCTVKTVRVETVEPKCYDVVSARAVAPLTRLLSLAKPFLGPGSICLFLKGKSAKTELTEAHRTWHTQTEMVPSETHAEASILIIKHVRRMSER
ncbi:MAG: 16S rRNA (guanine(527)-N(7))-methyltransferase RsmG [Pseudomonadota bacterium]